MLSAHRQLGNKKNTLRQSHAKAGKASKHGRSEGKQTDELAIKQKIDPAFLVFSATLNLSAATILDLLTERTRVGCVSKGDGHEYL